MEEFPVWSPNGQWIAFISTSFKAGTPTTTTLFLVSTDGSIQEPVISGVHQEPITWSPDGQWIIYNWHRYNWDGKARKVRVDGSDAQDYDYLKEKPLSDFPEGALDPAWSPDGQWVVFTYNGTSMSNNGKLFKIKVDGSELQQLTDLDCWAGSPDWIRMPGNE